MTDDERALHLAQQAFDKIALSWMDGPTYADYATRIIRDAILIGMGKFGPPPRATLKPSLEERSSLRHHVMHLEDEIYRIERSLTYRPDDPILTYYLTGLRRMKEDARQKTKELEEALAASQGKGESDAG